jgi:signal transduction histidine kinase
LNISDFAPRIEQLFSQFVANQPNDEYFNEKIYLLGKTISHSKDIGLLDVISSLKKVVQNMPSTMIEQVSGSSQNTSSFSRIIEMAFDFLLNITIPFEITHRGYMEYNVELKKMNADLELSKSKVVRMYEELSKKEREVQEYATKLESVDRLKEEFLSMISHELKTPLTPIKGFSQMLLMPKYAGETTPRQRKAIGSIIANVSSLEKIVNDVLDVYKFELGQLSITRCNIEIESFIRDILVNANLLLAEKMIKLAVHIKTVPGLNVNCDPMRIQQVLINLIRNAVDFVPKNGQIAIIVEEMNKRRDVAVANDKEQQAVERDYQNWVMISVEDNGSGIPLDKIDNLFKKFYQVDTSLTRTHPGTGLGLAVCKGIIESHGGIIWVDKNFINGTSVKFILPKAVIH